MKPARFILNSDYTTVRNTGEKTMSITIPNNLTLPAGTTEYTIGQSSTTLGSSTDSFMVYFTSSAFPYYSIGVYGNTKPSGASTTYIGTDEVGFEVKITGSTATFRAWCYGNPGSTAKWTGYGQTITAHILTFKDPFSE